MTEPSDQLESDTALQVQARPGAPDHTRVRVDPGAPESPPRWHRTGRNDDWYWIDDEDPFVVPWGYFEDDDL